MLPRTRLISAWLRDRIAPDRRRPRRSFVPLADRCEPRVVLSDVTLPTAVVTPSDPDTPPTPQAVNTDDPTDPADPSTAPSGPLLGTTTWN